MQPEGHLWRDPSGSSYTWFLLCDMSVVIPQPSTDQFEVTQLALKSARYIFASSQRSLSGGRLTMPGDINRLDHL